MQLIISLVLLLSRKNSLPHMCFPFTTHTEHFTSDTFGHQMCGFFFPSPQAIHYDTKWVSYKFNSDTVYLEIASNLTG